MSANVEIVKVLNQLCEHLEPGVFRDSIIKTGGVEVSGTRFRGYLLDDEQKVYLLPTRTSQTTVVLHYGRQVVDGGDWPLRFIDYSELTPGQVARSQTHLNQLSIALFHQQNPDVHEPEETTIVPTKPNQDLMIESTSWRSLNEKADVEKYRHGLEPGQAAIKQEAISARAKYRMEEMEGFILEFSRRYKRDHGSEFTKEEAREMAEQLYTSGLRISVDSLNNPANNLMRNLLSYLKRRHHVHPPIVKIKDGKKFLLFWGGMNYAYDQSGTDEGSQK